MEVAALTLDFTRHATTRLAQRGFRAGDVEMIMEIGTPVEGGYFVRDKDIAKSAQAPRRLAGTRLVIERGRIISAYHAGRCKSRRLLRSRNRR